MGEFDVGASFGSGPGYGGMVMRVRLLVLVGQSIAILVALVALARLTSVDVAMLVGAVLVVVILELWSSR